VVQDKAAASPVQLTRDPLERGVRRRTSRTSPAEATLAYTNFLMTTAGLCSVGETCAAMTPCMRLYAVLGQQLAPASAHSNPYREWIDTYASADFESLAARLETWWIATPLPLMPCAPPIDRRCGSNWPSSTPTPQPLTNVTQ
jgi:TENA/THI-4/PQQC family